MSVAELLHSNLCLLGYEKEASAAKIILSDETFEHANERAFQSVVHFLLRALDEERCRQTFRHCWPVLDKKQSAVFRQAVVAWLKEVKQTDPDGDALPQINPSLFLSPGGRRFKDLILALTQFVMLKSVQKLDSESPSGELVLTRGDPEIQCGTLRAASALGKQRFLQLQQARLVSHSHHQRFADSFSAQYRRLRQSISSLTVELGRMVAVSDLPPELTHRLLQENAGTVVPAVFCAARQHLAALLPALDRLRQFCRETEYSWQVAESIVTGAVAESVVDAGTLVTTATAGQDGTPAQSSSDLMVDGKLDLLVFFDTFVDKVEHLRQFLSHCPIGDLKGLHGTLPPLVREAAQLSSDAGRLLAQLQTETESAGRRLDRLLAAAPPPPPPSRARSVSPPPLLAPRTPNWSLSAAPLPPPGDHPLRHMYRSSPATDGGKLDLELSLDVADPSCSSRFSSLTSVTAGGSARSPWASPAAAPPATRLTAPTPSERDRRGGGRTDGDRRGGGRASEAGWSDTCRLTPTPSRETRARDTALSSCSSLFSPVCGGSSGAAGSSRLGSVCGEGSGASGSPRLGSVSSLAESVAETARPGGDASRARSPVRGLTAPSAAAAAAAAAAAPGCGGVGSPSPQVMRLRERTSVFLRSLTRSPVTGGDSGRPGSDGVARRSSPLPLDLSVTGGEARPGPGALRETELRQTTWQEGRLSRSSPSSPRGSELPRVAWTEEPGVGPGPGSPVALEVSPSGGRSRRRTRSGPGSVAPLQAVGGLSPAAAESGVRVAAAESGVRVATAESAVRHSPQCGAEPAIDSEFNFSLLNDKMAEELALTVFGPGDFNHSLDFSNRESLGNVELSLVDSDYDTVVPVSGRVEPPTDVLIDI